LSVTMLELDDCSRQCWRQQVDCNGFHAHRVP
jgi:hypothetical protein